MKIDISIMFQKFKRYAYYNIIRLKLIIPNFKHKKEHQYLFILSPPFSGSTLLTKIISSSNNVSCNNNIGTQEGQTLPEVIEIIFDHNRWDNNIKLPWDKIKKIWHKYWDLSKPILLEKSPPNIMRTKEIKETFIPISFICMVRNPYAQCESIIRRNGKSVSYAAKFALKCLEYQKLNIENEKNLIFFTYEELCENTKEVTNNIVSFISDLKDIRYEQKFKTQNFKTKKEMEITNLNSEKISKLTKKQISEINSYFKKKKELLNYFNYNII